MIRRHNSEPIEIFKKSQYTNDSYNSEKTSKSNEQDNNNNLFTRFVQSISMFCTNIFNVVQQKLQNCHHDVCDTQCTIQQNIPTQATQDKLENLINTQSLQDYEIEDCINKTYSATQHNFDTEEWTVLGNI